MLLVSEIPINKIISQIDKNIFIDRSFIEMVKVILDENICTKYNKNRFIDIIATFKEEWLRKKITTLDEYNEILRKILVIKNDSMEEYLKDEVRTHINAISWYKKVNEDIKNFIVKDFYVISYLFEPTEENRRKIEHPAYFSGTIDKIFLVYPQILYNKDVIKNICDYINIEDTILLKDRKHLLKIVKSAKKKKFFVATNNYINYKMCMAYLIGKNPDETMEYKLLNDKNTIDSLYRISNMSKEYNCFEEFFILRAINLCKKFNNEVAKETINNFESSNSNNSYEFYLNEYFIKTNKKAKNLTEENINEIRNTIFCEYLLVDLIEEENYLLSIKKFCEYFIGTEIFYAALIKIANENNDFIVFHRNKIKNLLLINSSYIENDSFKKKIINKRLLKSL